MNVYSEHFSALSRISSLRGGARSALNRLSVSGRVNRNLGKSFFAFFFFSIFELLCRGASQQTSENPNHTVSHFFVPRFLSDSKCFLRDLSALLESIRSSEFGIGSPLLHRPSLVLTNRLSWDRFYRLRVFPREVCDRASFPRIKSPSLPLPPAPKSMHDQPLS
jgi:hypothetical protein